MAAFSRTSSIRASSIYSASTLVGDGEEEARAESRLRRQQSGHNHPRHSSSSSVIQEEEGDGFDDSGAGGVSGINWTEVGDRVVGGITLSRRESFSTLHAPVQNTAAGASPSSSTSSPAQQRPTAPRITSASPDLLSTDSNLELRVPWWSSIVPNPTLGSGRRKSSSRILGNNTDSSIANPSSSSAASMTIETSPGRSTNQSNQASVLQHRLTARGNRLPSSQSTPVNQLSSSPKLEIPEPPSLPADYPLYARCYCEENAYLLAAYLGRVCRQRNHEELRTMQTFRLRWEVDVVVVSNKNQTVALWQQKASRSVENGYQVIWDYHVFVVVSCQREAITSDIRNGANVSAPVRSRSLIFPRRATDYGKTEEERRAEKRDRPLASWVYDFDTRLATPIPLQVYLMTTFGVDITFSSSVAKRYRPLFRVISAYNYFTRFGSDRSHMKRMTGPRSDIVEWIAPRPPWDLILGRNASLASDYFMDSFVDMRVAVGDGRFGVIVKLEELLEGVGLMAYTDISEDDALAAGVAVLLDQVPYKAHRTSHDANLSESAGFAEEDPQGLEVSIPTVSEDEQQELTPGVVIGGILRYGLRPPPPPPDGAIIPTNRGKRVMDPMFPAYIISAYEHRAASEGTSISS